MDQPRRTILMCEANVILAFRRHWIKAADLGGDEILCYFVHDARTINRPSELRRVFDEAEAQKRLLYNCEVPSQRACGHLEAFLNEHSFGAELERVIGIFEGAPSEFIDECYSRTPNLRVFGPYNPLSGFERRWEEGYAFIQR